jgi:TfoX N-terminal domain
VTQTADSAFAPIVQAFQKDTAVAPARMFGSDGLKVNGKVFAMLVKGDLVVKLPKERVQALTSQGLGHAFDPGHGRLMKEWVAIGQGKSAQWLTLAQEAYRFGLALQG